MPAWRNQYVHVDQYSRPGKKLKDVRKLIVHYTANPGASAANHFKYFDRTAPEAKRYASAHIFIDKSEAICIVPLDEVAYAAGDIQQRINGVPYRGVAELKPSANYLSISVELCVEKDGSFHADTLARAVDVFAELCKTYKLDPTNDIVRHYDVTHKNCPAPWVADAKKFVEFKTQVKAKLAPVEAVKAIKTNVELFKVGQIGRTTVLKPINLWKRDEHDKLTMVRVLNPGEVYRVYGYDEKHGGQYNVGDGCWITKMDGYVKYETPSKDMLAKAKELYEESDRDERK